VSVRVKNIQSIKNTKINNKINRKNKAVKYQKGSTANFLFNLVGKDRVIIMNFKKNSQT